MTEQEKQEIIAEVKKSVMNEMKDKIVKSREKSGMEKDFLLGRTVQWYRLSTLLIWHGKRGTISED